MKNLIHVALLFSIFITSLLPNSFCLGEAEKIIARLGPFQAQQSVVVPVQEITNENGLLTETYWLRIKTMVGNINESPSTKADVYGRGKIFKQQLEVLANSEKSFYVLKLSNGRLRIESNSHE